jgi:hypothetical protein
MAVPAIDSTGAFLIAAASDPNWFYSTVAQSTAAIVGLAGGFLAARLVSHRAEIARDREKLRQQFVILEAQLSERLTAAQQFELGLENVLAEIESSVRKEPLAPSR